ncbi:uncharacterized protein LOC126831875 isoform X2 [Patella vulgata]|nr:uncharacterized protein LOC126831875 isoform X2 [Patella vulgata]
MDKNDRTLLTNQMALNDDSEADTNLNQILSQNIVDKNERKSQKNKMAVNKTMDIPNSTFDILDYEEFLEDDIVTSNVKIGITKSAQTRPTKQSKWDFYTSPDVSDEEADTYPIHDCFHPLESDSKSLNYNCHAIRKDCPILEKTENCTSSNNFEPQPVTIQSKRDIMPVFHPQPVTKRDIKSVFHPQPVSKRDITHVLHLEPVTPVFHPQTDNKRDIMPVFHPQSVTKHEITHVLHPQTDTKRDITPVLHPQTDTKRDITPVFHPQTDTKRDITPVFHPQTDTKRDITPVFHPQTDTKCDIMPIFQVDDFNDAEFEFLV